MCVRCNKQRKSCICVLVETSQERERTYICVLGVTSKEIERSCIICMLGVTNHVYVC